jgi:quercetin dioxygenase-like cupin family protein
MSFSLHRVSLSHVADVLISAARPHRVLIAAAVVAAGVLACRDTTTPKESVKAVNIDPSSSAMGKGFKTTLIARGNLGTFDIKCKADGSDLQGESHDNGDNKSIDTGYCAELKSRDNTDIAVAQVDIPQGGFSGWHYHPGPVLVVVQKGTITFYSADERKCAPRVHPAGTAFIEQGGIVGIARNEGAEAVVAGATFCAPPAPSPLRIDAPQPANCPSGLDTP